MPSYANTQTSESQLMPPPLPPHSRRSGQQNLNQINDQHRNNGANAIETSRPNRFSRDSAGISDGLSLYSNENLLHDLRDVDILISTSSRCYCSLQWHRQVGTTSRLSSYYT